MRAFAIYPLPKGAVKKVILNIAGLALTVAVTGLSIFKPRATIVVGETVKIIENIYKLSISIYNLQGKQAATKLLSITHSAVFIASLQRRSGFWKDFSR